MRAVSLCPAGGFIGDVTCLRKTKASRSASRFTLPDWAFPRKRAENLRQSQEKARIVMSLDYPRRLKGRLAAATGHHLHSTRNMRAPREELTAKDSNKP